MLHSETTVHDVLPDLGLSSLEIRENSFSIPVTLNYYEPQCLF